MRFNFKKVAAIGASALLTGMSMGVAAAAAYPSPFTSGGTAVVYGSDAASTDVSSAYDLQSDLTGDSSGETTVSGETKELWLSSDKIYMNETLTDGGISLITDTDLPELLGDTTFQGAADGTSQKDTTVSTKLELSSDPHLVFAEEPTTDDDVAPVFVVSSRTPSPGSEIFNMTLNFDNSINFTDSDSQGETLTLLGKEYTVGASTTNESLVLLEGEQSFDLEVGSGASDPSSATATVDGEEYTIELKTATSSDAQVKVTAPDGSSSTKTISNDNSKTVNDVLVTVSSSYSSSPQDAEGANVAVSSETGKLTLEDGSKVKVGSDEDTQDGTNVIFSTATGLEDMDELTIQVNGVDNDNDAIREGETYTDPAFGSVNLIFSGLSTPLDSDDRETIDIDTQETTATVEFTTDDGDSEKVEWYYNGTNADSPILADSDGVNITVVEGQAVDNTEDGFEYVVVGNENTGHLLRVSEVTNDSSDGSDDTVVFDDVMTGESDVGSVNLDSDSTGTLTLEGASYDFEYFHNTSSGAADNNEWVRFDFDSDDGQLDVYPTIETSKGANLQFYQPEVINLNDSDGAGEGTSAVSRLDFPDGDGFSTFDVSYDGSGEKWDIDGAIINTSNGANGTSLSVGELTYVINGTGTANETEIRLRNPEDGSEMTLPGLVLFEEQEDDSNNYEALVVTMEGGNSGSTNDDAGVNDVVDTWNDDGSRHSNWDHEKELNSEDDMFREMDLWGTIVTVDKSTSDSHDATISYPDEQVYAKMYVGGSDSAVSGGGSGAGAEDVVVVTDSEVSSVEDRNLIVVGGSCINSVAANLVGGAYCGSEWTDNTNVGSGQFLVQSYDSPYTDGKVATLVAGYEASDTVNSATYLRTQAPDTEVGKKYVGSTSTSAELQTEESSD